MKGRRTGLVTADRVLGAMGLAPIGPAFGREVEAFLRTTGTKVYVLGEAAAGDPSFVERLRRGASLRLATVERVRGWMRDAACEAGLGAMRRAVAGAPFLDDACAAATGEANHDTADEGETGMNDDGNAYSSTRKAAAFLGLSLRTTDRNRMRGEGPSYYRFGQRVLYRETAMQEVRMRDGRTRVLAVTEIAASPEALAIRKRLREEVFASAILGAKASVVVIALFLALFWYRGRQLNRARRLRGAELATAAELARRIRPLHARLRRFSRAPPAEPYRIAGVPYPVRTETQHTIVSGTTGSGKTVLISDLVAQIRDKGERCVVYDKMGSYTRSFFDPARDVLLNPLDARAPRWSPFFEARNPRDFDTMAAALVPQQKDTVDPFWVTAARQLFSNGAGVLWKKGVTENKVLVDHLLKTELTALAEAMEGTVAQSIVDPENPKTALSVRAMLPGLDACDDVGGLLAGVVDGEVGVAMPAEADALRAAEGARLDDEDLLARGIYSNAEARKVIIPEDGVLAVDREAVHGALGEGAVLVFGHGAATLRGGFCAAGIQANYPVSAEVVR